jgi:nitrate reductase gamma subunit
VGASMDQRSKTILINVFSCVFIAACIAGLVVYFQYHQFHWWLLLGPAISIPLVVIAQRRQQHWDELRSRRERGEDTTGPR